MKSKLLLDLAGCAILALLALGTGMVFNRVRSEPLPLLYVRPAQRLLNVAGAAESPQTKNGEGDAQKPASEWPVGLHVVELVKMREIVAQQSALIVDARPDLFFEFGHIPGARNLSEKNFEADYRRLESEMADALQDATPVLIYCSNLHCPDAGKVSARLRALGFPTILVFEQGYQEWEAACL